MVQSQPRQPRDRQPRPRTSNADARANRNSNSNDPAAPTDAQRAAHAAPDTAADATYNRLKGPAAARERYGSVRSFVLRTLYTWFTMTLLAQSAWPLLVLQLDAPGVAPADTPLDWFQLRLLAPVLVALLAAWLWRLSPVPHAALDVAPAMALMRRGRLWPQLLLILSGTLLLLLFFTLLEAPGGGLKLALLALAEAAVIQVLCSGYLQSLFGIFLPTWRPAFLATVLYMLTFALRALLGVADEATVGSAELLAAALAGAFIGLLLGGISATLRARSSSLLPGTLFLWLVFVAFGLADVYDP